MSATVAIHSELAPVTATITFTDSSGSNYDGPVAVGFYQGQREEIWVEHNDHRFNVPTDGLNAFIKELRRAARIAQEQKE